MTPQQEKFISFDQADLSRAIFLRDYFFYQRKIRVGRGFVVLKDQTPEEDVFYVELAFKPAEVAGASDGGAHAGPDDDEPATLEEFEFFERRRLILVGFMQAALFYALSRSSSLFFISTCVVLCDTNKNKYSTTTTQTKSPPLRESHFWWSLFFLKYIYKGKKGPHI